MKTIETTHLIRFQDCDPFGHLNNSRFIDYFFNAREDHLIQFYDFNIHQYTKETGNSWVVGGHQIAYFSPAILMEKVIITSELIKWNTHDILLEMKMWNEQKSICKSIIWTRFIHINLKDFKKTEHGEGLNNTFSTEVNAQFGNLNFEDRVLEFKKNRI